MADINTSTPTETAAHAGEFQITKYDHLTTEQLIDKALRKFKNGDELALAVTVRLMDLQSEQDTWEEALH